MADLLDEIFKPLPFFELYKVADAKEKVLEALKTGSDALGDVSAAVGFAEFFADPEIADKLVSYRGHIDGFAAKLALPETSIKNFMAALKITKAAYGLRGRISDDPQAAALAFGKLFSGIGELAQYLPFPLGMYFEIFAGAEYFFENLRVQLQPEVHMREPGLRELIDDLP